MEYEKSAYSDSKKSPKSSLSKSAHSDSKKSPKSSPSKSKGFLGFFGKKKNENEPDRNKSETSISLDLASSTDSIDLGSLLDPVSPKVLKFWLISQKSNL